MHDRPQNSPIGPNPPWKLAFVPVGLGMGMATGLKGLVGSPTERCGVGGVRVLGVGACAEGRRGPEGRCGCWRGRR